MKWCWVDCAFLTFTAFFFFTKKLFYHLPIIIISSTFFTPKSVHHTPNYGSTKNMKKVSQEIFVCLTITIFFISPHCFICWVYNRNYVIKYEVEDIWSSTKRDKGKIHEWANFWVDIKTFNISTLHITTP